LASQFDHFSPQAFERMVQALCIQVLGPGTVIFGPGPDGGREAVFDGEVAYPSGAKRWKGYIVIQAKCRQQLRNNREDADWLCTELKQDLSKFTDPKRKLRKPQYYILASNVALSSHPKTGGKAKIAGVFGSYKKKLKLKGYGIWSADELRAFLENAEDVRRAYTAWLTPSDVLAGLVERLERTNLSRLLPLALTRDLRDERDVRLKDAGQETEKPIYLEHVFIDLPLVGDKQQKARIDDEDNDDQDDEKNDDDQEDQIGGVVSQLLRCAADKLDPASVAQLAEQPSGERRPLSNRIVLLGGPGQGKSTLSQFIAQVARARLLDVHQGLRLNPQIADLIKPILTRASAEGFSLNGPARFPIRIDIPGFADALISAPDKQTDLNLLEYVADRLSRSVTVKISADDLRSWLGTCPSIVMLDGLDEVPPTANREQVIHSINAFLDDLHLVQADTLVIVTTRPQGYNHDLDPKYWQHWELAPLPPTAALKYARRLAEVRASDPDQREEILTEIERASSDPATSSLLTSPLQVAILFGIAFLKGAIPRDRWDLFERYYILVRDREAQKPGSIIREYKRQIDALHQEAGFLLHVAAETAGKANAYLSPAQFKALIERLPLSEEFEADKIKSVSDELMRTATDPNSRSNCI
jgi:hypothetical protein